MERCVRIAAYLSNSLLGIFALLVLVKSYDAREKLLGLAALAPVLLNLLALYLGPDLEERKLARRLNKARMQDELRKLEQK